MDEKTLQAFFGQGGDKDSCLQAIGKCDIDRFRPLVNFLKGSTSNPDPKIVELLAWLIDFKPRPLELAKGAGIDSRDIPDAKQNRSLKSRDEIPAPANPAKPRSEFKAKKVIVAAIMLLVAVLGLYWAWPRKVFAPTGSQGCMYWVGDHYQPVPCDQKRGDTQVVPLDPEKLAHFKKITRPDTITENALGSIWYANFHGVYECYTSSGHHPIDTNLELKPLRDYVLIRHIHGNQGVEKISK